MTKHTQPDDQKPGRISKAQSGEQPKDTKPLTVEYQYKSPIRMVDDMFRNYPEVEGAGHLGDIVNKRWSDQWVAENVPRFPSFTDMAMDILIEDYNARHQVNDLVKENSDDK